MKTAVLYRSRAGNTQKLAQAIASAIDAPLFDVSSPPAEPVDLLFVGGAPYAGKLDKRLADFLGTLTSDRVKKLVFFSSSGSGQPMLPVFEAAVADKRIAISQSTFSTRGRAFLFLNRGYPNAEELESAAAFAKTVMADEAAG